MQNVNFAGVSVRVIDVYNCKSLDKPKLNKFPQDFGPWGGGGVNSQSKPLSGGTYAILAQTGVARMHFS
jgi:hypothetical protein